MVYQNPQLVQFGAGSVKRIWIPQLIVSLLLLWALNPANPYGYYTLLRLVSCATFSYLAYRAFAQDEQGWAWMLGITAVLYNPFIPVHLIRGIWSAINVVTIMLALTSILVLKACAQSPPSGGVLKSDR